MSVEEEVVDVQTATENNVVQAGPISMELPFEKEYLFYGVGAFALLILIFLVMRKPKKASEKELR